MTVESCRKAFLRIPPNVFPLDSLKEYTDKSSDEDSDELRLYFSGTTIAKVPLGSRYAPTHNLKLSQFPKAYLMGEQPITLLSRIGLCLSDMQRGRAEQRVVENISVVDPKPANYRAVI